MSIVKWISIFQSLPSFYCYLTIMLSSLYHHVPIIFPSFSHHLTIMFSSFYHHVPIMSNHISSFSQHFPLFPQVSSRCKTSAVPPPTPTSAGSSCCSAACCAWWRPRRKARPRARPWARHRHSGWSLGKRRGKRRETWDYNGLYLYL